MSDETTEPPKDQTLPAFLLGVIAGGVGTLLVGFPVGVWCLAKVAGMIR